VQGSILGGGKPSKAHHNGSGNGDAQPVTQGSQPASTTVRTAPARAHPAAIPPYVRALVPVALVLIAAVGVAVFERDEEELAAARTKVRPGRASKTAEAAVEARW
jgi:hypothetical protein